MSSQWQKIRPNKQTANLEMKTPLRISSLGLIISRIYQLLPVEQFNKSIFGPTQLKPNSFIQILSYQLNIKFTYFRYLIMGMKPTLQILLSFLLIGYSVSENPQTAPQHTTIVEGNHFYSNYETNTTYNIEKVSTDRSIIVILRKKDESQNFDNNISIQLISGDKSVECKYVSFNGLCYMQKLPSSNMTMKLRCDHLPCEVSWTIMQPPVQTLKQIQNIEQLYDISQSSNHMIAMVMCNKPDITNFDKLVATYSESSYVRGYTNNVIFLLFKKQESGHLFFKIQPEAKACAQMAIYHVTQQLIPDKQLKDFVYPNETNIYNLSTRPQGQFRIDCAYHQINKEPIKSELILWVTGQKNGATQNITSLNIKPSFATTNYQFSFALPQISSEYKNLQLNARSSNNIIIFNYFLSLSERAEIEESEHTHFKLKKGQVLKFKLVPEKDSEKSEDVSFFLSKPNETKISSKSCSKKEGCDFEVQALNDTQCVLYAGKNISSEGKGQVVFFDFKEKVTKKIRDQEKIYLRTPLKKDEAVRVIVNNPNVIIRAAPQQMCPTPSDDCYEKIGNSHHNFIYQPKKDGNLLMVVEGLDTCQFTISVISQGSDVIQLKDGEPFSYEMDDREKKIYFKFKIPQKTRVSFNLISPINDLLLVVNNGKEKPNGDEHTASSDGYISFAQSQLQSKQFRILIEKTSEAKHKFVHFTLIASTAGANIRLDPGVAHTESLKEKQYKQFVFQFDKKGEYLVNFYTPTVQLSEINIEILVNNQDKWKEGGKLQQFFISANSDVLPLKQVAQNLCLGDGQLQCEIFLRITNKMEIEIDITLTLLVKDSVIELKDGLWQSYAINTIAKTSHFYFLPTTKNSTISIMYKSTLVQIGISYSIWKSDKQDIDPSEWPFPPYKEDGDQKFSFYQPVNHISIDTENLKGCWPTCVILVSLFKKKMFGALFGDLDPAYQGNFSIMVANKVFELPEKSKVEITMKQEQEKYVMINLKYSLNKEALTFFVNSIIGSYSLFGSVTSEKNSRCPTISDYDFTFGELETQIKMSSIQNKINENGLDKDTNIYLCIMINAYLDSKFTVQYTSEDDIMKLLHYDSFQKFSIKPKQVKLYQLQANQKYELKFTREKGYFYVKIASCKEDKKSKEDQIQTCLEDLKSSKDRGKQIITKTEQFSEEPCLKCIIFIKIQADDQAEGVIHVQSKFSMITLNEKDVISDFTNQEEENKYYITSIQDEETVISVSVTEGDPVVNVTNYGALEVVKEKDPKTNNILIVIPPEKPKDSLSTTLGGIFYDAFAFSSTFRNLIVSVKSKDPKKSTAYSISYSSGERQTYLEDGLTLSYTLESKKNTIFLYKNPLLVAHGYLAVTTVKSSTMFNLNFKMYTLSDPNDEQTKVEVTPEKPPMRKHTPNPTIVYNMPVSKLVRIQIESQVEEKVTLLVLHQQLVILPFDQEFPFELHKGETINLITDVNNPGYLLLTIRKCDQSSPDFGYTFDYNSFQKSQFEYTTSLADQAKFQFYVKANKIGTLYMQMNVTDSEGLYAITIHYSQSKIKGDKGKPGKNGVVDYNIVDNNKAKVRFNAVVCATGSKCSSNLKYYWIAGNNLQDVYTQTVCPYSYFQTLSIISSQPLVINEIKAKADSNGVVQFEYEYKQHITYLAIKAVTSSQQIYYQPLEIITAWGTVSRAGRTHYMKLIVIGSIVLLVSLIGIRRAKRNSGYQQLGNNRQEFDY